MLESYVTRVKLNLKKAQGQINLVNKMIEDKRYCVDIAQQINAAIGILKQTNNLILESHLNTCAVNKLNSKKPGEREGFVRELIQTFNVAAK